MCSDYANSKFFENLFRRPALTIHTTPTVRPQTSRDSTTRITLPSHPAIGAQKPQPPHTMTQVTASAWKCLQNCDYNNPSFCFKQKPIFSTVAPVAAATVAPIVATNTVPSTTTIGIDLWSLYSYVMLC